MANNYLGVAGITATEVHAKLYAGLLCTLRTQFDFFDRVNYCICGSWRPTLCSDPAIAAALNQLLALRGRSNPVHNPRDIYTQYAGTIFTHIIGPPYSYLDF